MISNKEISWMNVKDLWVIFCGVADEYRMLRDRWLHLDEEILSLPILYEQKNETTNSQYRDTHPTFNYLDALVDIIEVFFEDNHNLSRKKSMIFKDFKEGNIKKTQTIWDLLHTLSTYVGLLKISFSQRIVSTEIPYHSYGIPRSPERTIGNELFYLATDNTMKSYLTCVNLPKIYWDGFVTFLPAVGEETFENAFFYPIKYLPLFHVAISDERKYTIPSYALAHEVGEAAMYCARLSSQCERRLDSLKLISYSNASLNTIKHSDEECKKKACPFSCADWKDVYRGKDIHGHIKWEYLTTWGRNWFQVRADNIAYRIAGKGVFYHCLNALPVINYAILLRLLALLGYMGAECAKTTDIEKVKDCIKSNENLNKMAESINSKMQEFDVFFEFENEKKCMPCATDVGLSWGITLYELKGIIDNLIKPGKDFSVDEEENTYIKECLKKGVICPEYEPKKVLHSYNELLHEGKKHNEKPNFAAAIHSLAFTTWKQ